MSHEEKINNGNTRDELRNLHKCLNDDIDLSDGEVNDVIEYVEKSIIEINEGLNKTE
ncbi:hypothetical protein SAMN06265348_12418 [Pedobacter westerhofensis]|uniref:Uncharacterized protein n=1 Tax=Pedobacter westerhofensis TaxID=425512 RepID=A0A521FTQ8_9SPHI|nr:hypothetical protein [Pedobacter westerhofensis]SMO99625.1 hypothetical protein SAMN06265348_12418 [Pedobacter westerhofensis]